jgi:hypothetical protein
MIEQVVRNPSHLSMPPERHDEIRMSCRKHLAVVREDWRISHLSRSLCSDIGVGILDRNQLHVRHGY